MTRRVMIVEPDRLHMKMFDDLLQAENLETELVSDYKLTHDDIRKSNVELMLISVEFPDESGLEFIKVLKNDGEIKSSIPMIAIFNHASSQEFERLRETKCDDYIPKPITVSRFLTAVSKSLNR